MIELRSEKWSELLNAYGTSEKIPDLLKQLSVNPSAKEGFEQEPWFSLWSSLYHQGDIYPASFAAVPHFADIASRTSYPLSPDIFLLPSWIEIARIENNIEMPDSLKDDYIDAIKNLTKLAENNIGHEDKLPKDFVIATQGMVLVGKGEISKARELLD